MADKQGDEDPKKRKPDGSEVNPYRAPDEPQAVALDGDLLTAKLDELMSHVFDFADYAFMQAWREPGGLRNDGFVKQGLALTRGYGQLVTVRDRHLKALREKG